MQKLRQFESLTLAIKISFLFDFCTDVLLSIEMCVSLNILSIVLRHEIKTIMVTCTLSQMTQTIFDG